MKGGLLVKHLSDSLPDSISGRKRLLRDTLDVVEIGSECSIEIMRMLRTLELHEAELLRIQAELPLTGREGLTAPEIIHLASPQSK